MIHRLEMKGYRGFERYTLANLSRVNLLVGRNNSGKSAILEAVQLLADGGGLRTLDEIARRRGETLAPNPDPYGPTTTAPLADVSHFFHGHSIKPGSHVTLWAEGDVRGGAVEFSIEASGKDSPNEHHADFNNVGAADAGRLFITVEGRGIGDGSWDVPGFAFISEDGALELRRSALGNRRPGFWGIPNPFETLFVSSDSLDRSRMAELWNDLLTDGDEQAVVQAMQILEPDLTSVAFLSGQRSSPSDPRGGIVVGFQGESRRRPLGSYGEGMRRLLALGVAAIRTKNGVLLIDEVDTGLHYSILGDVWELIVEAAVRNDVQVFLTTHSLDCLRALAWLCITRPDLAGEVSLQKIERRLDKAVAFDASEIQIAVDQDIEVR